MFLIACSGVRRPALIKNAVRKTPIVNRERFQGGASRTASATTAAKGVRRRSGLARRGGVLAPFLGLATGCAATFSCAALTRHATSPSKSERRAQPTHGAWTPIRG